MNTASSQDNRSGEKHREAPAVSRQDLYELLVESIRRLWGVTNCRFDCRLARSKKPGPDDLQEQIAQSISGYRSSCRS